MSIYEMYNPVLDNAETTLLLLKHELNISEITARLLINRGITSVMEARTFLKPSLEQLHDPYTLVGMDRAVKRIHQALAANGKIVVYGDYDVDGITSSSILCLYLKSLGACVDVYIPSRHEDGYGLHHDALMSIKKQGTSLVITVDCGITAIDEVKAIQPEMDIIITDHHTPGFILPDAYAVINPKIGNQKYEFSDLAGVGVTGKLIQALGGKEAIIEYLDLIAIGTVADIVPLIGENRVFVSLGLQQINRKPRPGVEALIKAVGIDGQSVDSGKISYSLAPCLNAPGRMTTFHKGFELLTADKVDDAIPVAMELVEQNKTRREVESQILEAVRKKIPEQVNLAIDRIIVVDGEDWHPGVIGIVASKISEQYHRPSVIISLDNEQGVASARSIKGFDLYKALSSCKDLFSRFGGHEQAAGLSILKKDINEFRKRICAYAVDIIDDELLIPHFIYDGKLTPEDITPNLHKEIDRLAPFGFGNSTPKFLLSAASIESSRLIGKEAKHLKLALALGQRSWDAIGFGMADAEKDLQLGCKVNLLTSLKLNEWMGVSSTQFQIHSMKRVYKGQKDLDDLLSSFYYKFFNAFLSEFMYNDNDASLKSVYLNQTFTTLGLEEVSHYLKNSMVGTAILINTLDAAKLILRYLQNQDILDTLSLRYNIPTPVDGLGGNTIILAPDYKNMPKEHYHTLMIPEMEHGLLKGNYRKYVHQDKKNHKIILNDVIGINNTLKADYSLSREQLAAVYKWLRRVIPGKDYWPDASQLLISYQENTGYKLNGFQILLALEIFKELGFIALDKGNQYIKVRCVKNPMSRQLDESKIYTFHKAWVAGFSIEE